MNKYPENDWRNYFEHSDESMKYGLPEKKKYPMPDKDHVMSAIKFFNYVSPSDEKELARNIIARIKEYGITGINVGKNNRFGKYYEPEQYLKHHGIKGQKWGVQNGPPYPLSKEKNLQIRSTKVHSKRDLRGQEDGDEVYTKKNSDILRRNLKYEKVRELDRKVIVPKNYNNKELDKDLISVNPRSNHDDKIGSYFNCRNCALALEMRRRGYDVQARRRDDGSNAGDLSGMFKGGKIKAVHNDFDKDPFFKTKLNNPSKKELDKFYEELDKYSLKGYQNLCSELSKGGLGARGIVVIGWQPSTADMTKRGSFFHALNYEVKKDQVHFYDSQGASSGFEYTRGFSWQYADPRDYQYMRTDNLEPSDKIGTAVISASKSDRSKIR